MRPDVQALSARTGRTRPFDCDVHLIQHFFKEFIGLGNLDRPCGAHAVVNVTLKGHLREVDIVGGDECGVVYVDGVVNDRMLLLAREQAERKVDHQQADRQHSQLSTKRALIPVGYPIRPGPSIGRSGLRFRIINRSRGHAVTLP